MMTFQKALSRQHPVAMRDKRQRESDFDRNFWRACARRTLQQVFNALETGRIAFGSWERLFLSAAIDNFRYRNFKQSAESAQRIFSEHRRQPFPGRFTQEKNLADFLVEYEELVRPRH
jgi:hypothetical protein